jgi:hypothetical protein
MRGILETYPRFFLFSFRFYYNWRRFESYYEPRVKLGQTTREDVLDNFFFHKFEMASLVDIEPIVLKPTWSNKKSDSKGF